MVEPVRVWVSRAATPKRVGQDELRQLLCPGGKVLLNVNVYKVSRLSPESDAEVLASLDQLRCVLPPIRSCLLPTGRRKQAPLIWWLRFVGLICVPGSSGSPLWVLYSGTLVQVALKPPRPSPVPAGQTWSRRLPAVTSFLRNGTLRPVASDISANPHAFLTLVRVISIGLPSLKKKFGDLNTS